MTTVTEPLAIADNATYDLTVANQRLAADPKLSVWASANAGAGKTKVLIDRIARLLLAGAQPQTILAVTYTKAAAAEMQTRLFETLGKWTVASDEDLIKALKALEPDVATTTERLSLARRLFAAALEAPGGLQIQTIHSFCTAILQRFPLEAGLTPGFRVLEETETQTLKAQALDQAIANAPEFFDPLVARLDGEALAQQLDAAWRVLGAQGARQADLQATFERACRAFGCAPDFDLLGSWRKLLEERGIAVLKAASQALATAKLTDTEAKKRDTFHSICEAILANAPTEHMPWTAFVAMGFKQDGERANIPPFNKGTMESSALRDLFGGPKDDGWPGGLYSEALQLEQHFKAQKLARWSHALANAAFAQATAFARLKKFTGALDFNDLLARTAKLLNVEGGAAKWVLYKLDSGISHVLIDEAQDTSPEQWDLFRPLLDALDEEERNEPRTRFVVGDEKQSIYSFQGAKPERFLEERTLFSGGGQHFNVKRETLEFGLSFRTGQVILDAVDAVWQVCGPQSDPPIDADRLDDEAGTIEPKFLFARRHSANRRNSPGMVEWWPAEPRFRLTNGVELGDDDDASLPLDTEHDWSPSNGLAERIAQELKSRFGTALIYDKQEQPRPLTPDDVMILLPARDKLFHQIIRRLKAADIPVAGIDRINLPGELAVQDLLALGRFALTPLDDFNLACVLKGPFCGLVDDQADLWPLAHGRGSTPLWATLCQRADERPDWAAAYRLLSEMKDLGGDRGPYSFYATVLEQEWACPDGNGRTGWQLLIERLGREVREPVEIFLARALDHGANAPPGLMNFIQAISEDTTSIKRELEKGAGGVRVMTVHGAKGLEAPMVILPGLTKAAQTRGGKIAWHDGERVLLAAPESKAILPPLNMLKDDGALAARAESARLLYVAMTRARDHLILCGHASGKPNDKAWSDSTLPDGTAIEVNGFKGGDNTWWNWVEQGMQLLGGSPTAGGATTRALVTVPGHPDLVAQVFGTPPVLLEAQAPPITRAPMVVPDWVNQTARSEHWSGPATIRRLSPSRLIDDDDTPAVNSPLSADASRRFLRGRLIHTLLQILPDHSESQWLAMAQARLSREPELDDPAREEIAGQVIRVLQDPTFAAVFGPGSRAEVRVAGHGAGLPDGVIINGTIDRLVVTESQVLVLDFKTNRPPPKTVDQVARSYLVQMAAYRALLQATWPGREVQAALLWTDVPSLMTLPGDLLDKTLQSLQKARA